MLLFDLIAPYLPKRLALARSHRWIHGDLRFFFFPGTFNEIINHIKIDPDNRLRSLTADKIAVRDYVTKRIGSDYLIPLIAVIEQTEDLDLERLPNAFILKAAHGSGMNLIVRDKATVRLDELRALVIGWLQQSYSWAYEEHYKGIPHRIAVEELLLDENQQCPRDYKLFVFRGKVVMISVDTDRFNGHQRNFFTPQWQELAVESQDLHPNIVPPPRPRRLEELIKVAEKLAQPFSFVRIDLYEHEGRIYFGEVTHTPGAGEEQFVPREFDRVLGTIWRKGGEIPEKYYVKASSQMTS